MTAPVSRTDETRITDEARPAREGFQVSANAEKRGTGGGSELARGYTVSVGNALLDELRAELVTYIIFPSDWAADAVTLWIAATHAQICWQHAPRCAVVSPEKQCGKSRVLDIATELVAKPLITVNASPPAIYRSITLGDPPTLLVDEADAIFGKKPTDSSEDLRALLNAGHQRNQPALRFDMVARRVAEHPTFSMAMIAGIGDLPDTIMDRAVIVRMRRRAPKETVRPFRTRRDVPRLHDLRDRVALWMDTLKDRLRDDEPDMPVEDRAADTWEPLVAVADAAGGPWPERARTACVGMVSKAKERGTDASLPLRLLVDLRSIFVETKAPVLHTATILEHLHKIEDAPWGEFFGRQFNANDLGKVLREYEVSSLQVRVGTISKKGYRREHLDPVWERYIPDEAAAALPDLEPVPVQGLLLGDPKPSETSETSARPPSSGAFPTTVSDTPDDLAKSETDPFGGGYEWPELDEPPPEGS